MYITSKPYTIKILWFKDELSLDTEAPDPYGQELPCSNIRLYKESLWCKNSAKTYFMYPMTFEGIPSISSTYFSLSGVRSP
jgi:hypothetical protein